MIKAIIVLAYFGLCVVSGYYLLVKLTWNKDLYPSSRVAISFVIGAMLEMLLAHAIAFSTHSFRLATYISLGLLTILNMALWIASPSRLANNDASNQDARDNGKLARISSLTCALALALIYGLRDLTFSNPDRVHNVLYANIANNNIYPPSASIDLSYKLTDYHYGTDLMGATLKIISGLSSWDVQSLQIAIWVFIFFLITTTLIEHYCKSAWLALYGAITITAYTSIASYAFLIKDWSEFFNYDISVFLLDWIKASWTSISSVNAQLRLGSQNMALGIFMTLLLLIVKKLDEESPCSSAPQNDKLYYYPIILILSFGLYFIYPSLYYPLIAAIAALAAIYLLKSLGDKKYWINFTDLAITFACFYIGRILTGTSNSSTLAGVKTIAFTPHLSWTNWGKPYLRYFFDINYLQKLGSSFDHVTNQALPEIPLFSWISFLDFGDLMITALVIVIYYSLKNNFYIKQKINSLAIIIITGLASTAAGFSIVFLPRPIEATRFILWAKVCCLIFVTIVFLRYLETLLKSWTSYKPSKKITYITLAVFISLGLVPGVAAIYPDSSLNFLGNKALSQEERAVLKDLELLHRSGDIVLDSRLYEIGATFSSLVGYFSIGGQVYKEDQLTRETALNLMSPRLLKELAVNYILINPAYQLNPKAAKRLSDAELFTEITDIAIKHPGYHFYRFRKPSGDLLKTKEPVQEYLWVLAYQQGNSYRAIPDPDKNLIIANSRLELDKPSTKIKALYAKEKPIIALWMRAQAIPRSAINHP